MLGWIILSIAIVFEIAGSICLKLSYGLTKTLPSIFLFLFYGLGITFASFAIRFIDISVAYTVWAGVGTAAIAIIGMTYFNEPITGLKIASIMLVIIGVIGLNLQTGK